jgi:hypothetical protein
VWLTPGPSSAAVTAATAAIGSVGMGLALYNADPRPLSLGLMLGVSACTALVLSRSEQRLFGRGVELAHDGAEGSLKPRRVRARPVTMAVVPWGVVVTPDTDPRVLRWPAVRRVTVDVSHTMRGGTPFIVASFVTVHTEHEVLTASAPGAVGLERLVVNVGAYGEEAARPQASDLDGLVPAGDDATEEVAESLIKHAEELCASGSGAARLALPSGGYRSVATRRAAPETLRELHTALYAVLDTPADPRPLAAILAGMLGAIELVPDLLRLVSSPHPMVAAFAKAAALRLGAPLERVGAVDEVAAFLFEEDLHAIQSWAIAPPGGVQTQGPAHIEE